MAINKKLNEDYFKTKRVYKRNNDKGKSYKEGLKRNIIMFIIFIICAFIISLLRD